MAEQFCVLGYDHGQLVAGIGTLEVLRQVPGVEVANVKARSVDFDALSVTLCVSGSSQRSCTVAMRPSAFGRKVTA